MTLPLSCRYACRRAVVKYLVLFVFSVSAYSEAGVLVPREVFIGDTADFTFAAGQLDAVLALAETAIPGASGIPETEDATIVAIAYSRRVDSGSSVTIRFIPWRTGVLQLPQLEFRGVKVAVPPVVIASLVERTGRVELQNARSPLLIPGTTWLLYGVLACCIAGAAAAIYISIRVYRYLFRDSALHSLERRTRYLARELRILERRIKKTPHEHWYAVFSRTARTWLSFYCKAVPDSFFPLSAIELANYVARVLEDATDRDPSMDSRPLVSSVADFFSGLDVLRFSGRPYSESRMQDMDSLRRLANELETFLDHKGGVQ